MRTFYIFVVNDVFMNLYIDKPDILYDYLKKIRLSDLKIESLLSMFRFSCNVYNQEEISEYLRNSYNHDDAYSNEVYCHYYRNELENTCLEIKKTFIRIKTDRNNPVFLREINKFQDQLFICDFENNDYGWLGKIFDKIVV